MSEGPLEGIRCIAFDAVGTLIRPVPSVAEAYRAVGVRHGSRLGTDEIRRRFAAAFAERETEDLGAGPVASLVTSEAGERRRWRRIVTQVLDDATDPDGCFEELFEHFARPESWECYADVARTLTGLRDSGFRLAIASNFDARLHGLCDGLGPLRGVERRVVSSLVGHRKPAPEFYAALLSLTDCAPHELLMVGDDLECDVRGALNCGLRAVRVNRTSTVETDIARTVHSLDELLGWTMPGGHD